MKKIKIPVIKKNIQAFLTSEEGSISKQSVAKIGLTIITSATILSGVMRPDQHFVSATCEHSVHSSHASHASHSSHENHNSHGSHGSHSSHGSY